MWKARGIDRSWKRRVGPPMISSKIDIKNNKLIPDSTHRQDSLYVCMMNAESPNQATWIIKIRPRESGDSGAGDVILGQYLAPFLVDRLRVGCRTLWTACAGSNHTGFIFRVTRTDFSSLHLSNYLSLSLLSCWSDCRRGQNRKYWPRWGLWIHRALYVPCFSRFRRNCNGLKRKLY